MKFKSEPKESIRDDADDRIAQGDAVNRKGRKAKRKSRRKESRK
jgi:hypothetical protein